MGGFGLGLGPQELSRLTRLDAHPAHGVGDLNRPGFQIDALPAQRQGFTLPNTHREGDQEQRTESIIGRNFQERPRLLGVDVGRFPLGDFRRRGKARGVVCDEATADGVVERGAQDCANVMDSLGANPLSCFALRNRWTVGTVSLSSRSLPMAGMMCRCASSRYRMRVDSLSFGRAVSSSQDSIHAATVGVRPNASDPAAAFALASSSLS